MFTLSIKNEIVVFNKPVVMGIINLTPDSFFENSRKQNEDAILFEVDKMLNEGATFIDIGGQSTRPGSELISVEDELKRVLPNLELIIKKFPEVKISIDTFYAKVTQEAIQAGAVLVNDISGGSFDENMLSTVALLNVPYVCMHLKGQPKNMQQQTTYVNVVDEVKNYFSEKITTCESAGINDVIIDIGFGFAKTAEQNFELVKNLNQFKPFKKPILLGVSRKSSIYKTLGITANEALNGTTVLNTIGLLNGANILRVHDVKEAVEVVKLAEYFY